MALQQLVEKYTEGSSTQVLGTVYGVSSSTISHWLKAAGVSLRPAGFRFGVEHHAWVGGRINKDGYILRRITPEHPYYCMAKQKVRGHSYVLEHRLVVAEQLGRPLREDETVHHIDGVRSNNVIENLQLRQGHHGNGVVLCCADCGSVNIRPAPLGSAH